MQINEQTLELVDVDKLIPHPDNPRRGDLDAISASITANGFYGAVVAQRSTGYVLAGNHRLAAVKRDGGAQIPCFWLECSDVQARRILSADNRTASLGIDDPTALAELLTQIAAESNGSLEGTGYSQEAFDAVVAAAGDAVLEASGGAPVEETEGENECPDIEETVATVKGDLWILGKHRLLCGDSTLPEELARLTGGAKVDIVITDPPYGIAIVKVKGESKKGGGGGPKPFGLQSAEGAEGVVGGGGSAGHMYPYGGAKKGVGGGKNIVKPKLYAPIANDDNPDAAEAFFRNALESGIQNFIIFGGNYFTHFLAPSPCWVIWDKQNSGNFADVEMAWTSFDRGAKLYQFMWNGLCRAGDRKTELKTRVHPTQKPVGLFVKIFADFEFNSCFDGFLGSGTTLIACEKTNRFCFGMELSPDYCDVIVKRWQTFTNQEATLEGDGRTFQQVADARRVAS